MQANKRKSREWNRTWIHHNIASNSRYYFLRSFLLHSSLSNALFLRGKLYSKHTYTRAHTHYRYIRCMPNVSESLRHLYVSLKLIFRNRIFEGIKCFETCCDKLRIKRTEYHIVTCTHTSSPVCVPRSTPPSIGNSILPLESSQFLTINDMQWMNEHVSMWSFLKREENNTPI